MLLTIENTSNHTIKLNYITDEPRSKINNEIWSKREKELNEIDKDFITYNAIMGGDFIDKFDAETSRIASKTSYNLQKLNIIKLIAELKGLSPLYSNYTIITYDFNSFYYDDDTRLAHAFFSSDEEIEFDDKLSAKLIGKPFTDLIELLTAYKNIHNFAVTKFNVELLPANVQKKSNRKRTNIPRGLRHEVFKRDNYTCREWGAKKSDGATLHVDHIIPVSKGGTDELDNLQTLCSDCNLNKSNLLQ